MMQHARTPSRMSLQACIEACQRCHQLCFQTATTQCLQRGGKHVEENHFRLMLNCAEICATTANFLLSHSAMYQVVCAACAKVCKACAQSCEETGDMEACAQACWECATACIEAGDRNPHHYISGRESTSETVVSSYR